MISISHNTKWPQGLNQCKTRITVFFFILVKTWCLHYPQFNQIKWLPTECCRDGIFSAEVRIILIPSTKSHMNLCVYDALVWWHLMSLTTFVVSFSHLVQTPFKIPTNPINFYCVHQRCYFMHLIWNPFKEPTDFKTREQEVQKR